MSDLNELLALVVGMAAAFALGNLYAYMRMIREIRRNPNQAIRKFMKLVGDIKGGKL